MQVTPSKGKLELNPSVLCSPESPGISPKESGTPGVWGGRGNMCSLSQAPLGPCILPHKVEEETRVKRPSRRENETKPGREI